MTSSSQYVQCVGFFILEDYKHGTYLTQYYSEVDARSALSLLFDGSERPNFKNMYEFNNRFGKVKLFGSLSTDWSNRYETQPKNGSSE